MHQLPEVDIAVLVIYLAGVVGLGCWFVRKSGTTKEFMAAGSSLPGWAVGLSIFGTFLSSNTFLGVPGKAYAENWNAFVFSLSLPLAAFLAVRFFVPFYRNSGEISAYHHLEHRFGSWARTYAVVCYLLTQFARMGSILLGVSLALSALTGWDMFFIIIVAGILITAYTMLGGIEAVIWTDVVQSLVLTVGALSVLVIIFFDMPEGPGQIWDIAHTQREAGQSKLSLGSLEVNFAESTFWTVFIYGIFINLNNFGIDQSFVQRYHTARNVSEAGRSVWFGALLYIPISFVFFLIGTSLFAYYQTHPELMADLRREIAEAKLNLSAEEAATTDGQTAIAKQAAELTDKELGDKVFPHFIVVCLPPGITGLLVAALFAAAMSSVDTSLNSSATVILQDFYKRFWRPSVGEKESMLVLYSATLAVGTIGTGIALAMIGQNSVLEVWWRLSGIFAGGMLGLFLLGIISRQANSAGAICAVIVGILVIFWMTFSPGSELPDYLQSPFDMLMVTAIGTIVIFLVGVLASRLFGGRGKKISEMEKL